MPITDRLASSRKESGQAANVEVARQCAKRPQLLEEVVAALGTSSVRQIGDLAEVLTKVAEEQPELVAPYVRDLLPLLEHKNGRVRWESAHAVALCAAEVPRLAAKELPRWTRIAREDESVIVRDYVLDAIAGYGRTGKQAARAAFPILSKATSAWGEKHAARILRALPPLVAKDASLREAAMALAKRFADHARPGVRKEASKLLRQLASR